MKKKWVLKSSFLPSGLYSSGVTGTCWPGLLSQVSGESTIHFRSSELITSDLNHELPVPRKWDLAALATVTVTKLVLSSEKAKHTEHRTHFSSRSSTFVLL